MSAVAIYLTKDAAHIWTDGAIYRADGTLAGRQQKVHILAHLDAVISVRGPQDFGDALAAKLNGRFSSFDELATWLPIVSMLLHEHMNEAMAACETGPHIEVYLAGWSASGNRPQAFVFWSFPTEHADAWTPAELEHFSAAPGEKVAAAALPLPSDDEIGAFGLKVLEIQREERTNHLGIGPEVCGVGAFGQWTVVKEGSIHTGIVKRWPDEIGQRIGECGC